MLLRLDLRLDVLEQQPVAYISGQEFLQLALHTLSWQLRTLPQ